MGVSEILSEIDQQIERLQQARTLLLDGDGRAAKRAMGVENPPKKKRNLSPEGRKRFAEAVKRLGPSRRKLPLQDSGLASASGLSFDPFPGDVFDFPFPKKGV